jgi:copper chaperone CopZ
MKKNTYKLDEIDCAACGLKIEDGVNNLAGVYSSSLNYMLLKLFVTFDENIVSDEEIETCIHKSLSGVKIVQKNNKEFIDTYEEKKVFKKILFKGRKKR